MNMDKMRKALDHWRTTIDERPTSADAFAAGWQAATRAAVPAWQPIWTAPKDGARVLTYRAGFKEAFAVAWFDSSYSNYCWNPVNGNMWPEPTHWMPLPPAPEEKT